MIRHNRSKRTLIVAAIVLLAGCTGAVLPDEMDGVSDDVDIESGVTPADGELEIHHIDVGQGDATLIVTPDDETILIDSGDWRQSGQQVIDYLDGLGVDRIDHLVATHGHADHIGGHDEIIKYYETEQNGIGAAYDSGVAHTSQTYDRYLDAIEQYDVDLFEVAEGDQLPVDDESLRATVLNPPEGDTGDDLHYNSVALLFDFGEFSYLTTGDAETAAEQRMINEWDEPIDVDIYQVGHHGSSTSSTEPFMSEVEPGITIISAGYDNQYGHPHSEVLERFDEHGVQTYWTGVHGDVVLTTDGRNTTIDSAVSHSTDPADLLNETVEQESEQSYSLTMSVEVVTQTSYVAFL